MVDSKSSIAQSPYMGFLILLENSKSICITTKHVEYYTHSKRTNVKNKT